jgi:hypothetical protein
MIKPEFWDDEKLARIPRDARLLFAGLWSYSDDYGVVKGSHVWLKSKIFPYDDSLKIGAFNGWMEDLERNGFIVPFESCGEKYYYIRKFSTHQVINRPSKQRNPEPPDEILNGSLSTHGAITDESESESETESETKTETETVPVSVKPRSGRTYHINLNYESGEWEGITERDLSRWKAAFPSVDLDIALKEISVYWVERPKNKRTNWGATITKRLAHLQENGRPSKIYGPVDYKRREQEEQHKREYAELEELERQLKAEGK